MRKKLLYTLARIAGKALSESELDTFSKRARWFQYREEDGWFTNKEGERQQCRMEVFNEPDPIMDESGCAGEFANDFRKQDIRDGCPICTGSVMENASEPDVMQRWGFHRYGV